MKPTPSPTASTAMPEQASGNQQFNPMVSAVASAQPTDPTAVQNRQDQKQAFVANGGDIATRNPASLQLPTSPYQVMAGTIIPAALATGINSDLPGQVIANVTEAVYDTATGRFLLIPQGSRLIGRYDSQVAFGTAACAAGVDALDFARYLVDFARPSARHRPGGLCRTGRWRRLALGSHPRRRGVVHAARSRC